jgi:porphobilinogen deaminase
MTQKNVLALGILQNDSLFQFQMYLEQILLKVGINPKLVVFSTQNAALQAVVEGKVAAFSCTLDTISTNLPTGLVITALSARLDANTCFVTLNEGGLVFDKAKKVKVLVLSDINRAQMQYLEPDFEVTVTDLSPNESIEAVRSGAYDAVVLSQTQLNLSALKSDKWQIQMFSVREFIPSAGQSVACFVVAEDDLPTRRLLKEIHHPSVSAVTNIERTVQKMLKDHAVSAYCERDRMGNYHLGAAALVAGILHKTRLSQSTTFGMAEKVCEQLLSA